MDNNYSDIIEILKSNLKPERFIHVLGVKDMCCALALRYDYDMRKAELAGLLHDIAKAYPTSKHIEMAEDYSIELTDMERKAPQLIHAKLGCYLARKNFGIDNEEILHAILVHTTSEPDMSLLDKILFVSDYIEPSRYQMENLNEIRKVAFEDLNKAVFLIAENTIKYLEGKGDPIDPKVYETFSFYKEK